MRTARKEGRNRRKRDARVSSLAEDFAGNSGGGGRSGKGWMGRGWSYGGRKTLMGRLGKGSRMEKKAKGE